MAGLDGTLLDSELIYQGNKEKFPTQDQPKQFLIYTDVLPRFNWRLIDKIVGQLDQLLTKYYPTNKKNQEVPPVSSFLKFIQFH